MINQGATSAAKSLSRIADRLEECRRLRRMTQQQVVDAMKGYPDGKGNPTSISRAAYAQWEAGIVSPGVDRIAAFAWAVEADPAYVAFGDIPYNKEHAEVAWIAELDGNGSWAVPIDEIRKLGADANKLKILAVDFDLEATSISRGSQVMVDTSVQDVASPSVYAYQVGDLVSLASMMKRPAGNTTVVVVRSGGSTFESSPNDLTILGRALRAWVSV